MDSKARKSCLEEISHLVCDQDKKLVISKISNDWNVSLKTSEDIVKQWLKNYKGKQEILKYFLIRGIDSNGNGVITIVPADKLDVSKKTLSNVTLTLYSIELKGENGKRLDIPEESTNIFVSLPIESATRQCKVSTKPVQAATSAPVQVKTETQTRSTSKASKGAEALFRSSEAMEEKKSPQRAEIKIKEEKSSSKKESPQNKESSKSSQPVSRKSISSFFSKPTAGNSSSISSTSSNSKVNISNSVAEVEKEIKKEVIEEKPVSKKRVHDNSDDDDVIQGTPQEKRKKVKMEPIKTNKNENGKGRSRLMKICDSSSDEEQEKIEDDEVKSKKEKENTTPTKNESIESMEVDNTKANVPVKGRRKVKKTVTKTFEDEEGYINTVHVTEEVSCSEDEPEAIEPPKETKSNENLNGNKKDSQKKKISPPTGKKQGSILSFFGKK